MQKNTINFDDFTCRYFNGEEFLFMYKNLSLHFKIIDSAHILEYSDGYKIKYMQIETIEHLYHVTMNGTSIEKYWKDLIHIEK